MMNADMIMRAVELAMLGALSVSIWTVRVALAARGRRTAASITAGADAVVFAIVFASVLSSMDSPLEIVGYAAGVAAGTFAGVVADGRLTHGKTVVRVVVDGDGHPLAAALGERGWPMTLLPAEGSSGAAALLLVVVEDARVPRLVTDLEQLAPTALWTLARLQTAHAATF